MGSDGGSWSVGGACERLRTQSAAGASQRPVRPPASDSPGLRGGNPPRLRGPVGTRYLVRGNAGSQESLAPGGLGVLQLPTDALGLARPKTRPPHEDPQTRKPRAQLPGLSMVYEVPHTSPSPGFSCDDGGCSAWRVGGSGARARGSICPCEMQQASAVISPEHPDCGRGRSRQPEHTVGWPRSAPTSTQRSPSVLGLDSRLLSAAESTSSPPMVRIKAPLVEHEAPLCCIEWRAEKGETALSPSFPA